jgi:hypothetical protein
MVGAVSVIQDASSIDTAAPECVHSHSLYLPGTAPGNRIDYFYFKKFAQPFNCIIFAII